MRTLFFVTTIQEASALNSVFHAPYMHYPSVSEIARFNKEDDGILIANIAGCASGWTTDHPANVVFSSSAANHIVLREQAKARVGRAP